MINDSARIREIELYEGKLPNQVPYNYHKFMTQNTELSLLHHQDDDIMMVANDDESLNSQNAIADNKFTPNIKEDSYRDRYDTDEKKKKSAKKITYSNRPFGKFEPSSLEEKNLDSNGPVTPTLAENLQNGFDVPVDEYDHFSANRFFNVADSHRNYFQLKNAKKKENTTLQNEQSSKQENPIVSVQKRENPKMKLDKPKNVITNVLLNRAKNKFKRLTTLNLSMKALELLDDFTIIKTQKREGYVDIVKTFSVTSLKEHESLFTKFMKTKLGTFLKKKFPNIFRPRRKVSLSAQNIELDEFSFKNWKEILKTPISPMSKFRLIWDTFLFIFLLITMIVLPLELSFGILEDNLGFEYANLTIFTMDILLNFHTGYLKKGELITSHRLIARNYLRSWFFIDLLSTFPFGSMSDLFFANTNTPDSAQLLKLFRILRLLKVLRALRFFKLSSAFKTIKEFLKISEGPVRLIRLLFTVVFLAHWLACIWHLVAFYEPDADLKRTWLHKQGIYDSDISVRYIRSIYWALTTMLTVGYGDIVPVTLIETWFVILAELFGCGVFAYALNTVGQVAGQLTSERTILRKKINFISDFFQHNRMNPEIHYKLKSYLEYLVEEGTSQQHEQDQFLSMIPDSMKKEIMIALNSKVLLKNDCLKNNFSNPFLCSLSYKLKERVAGPGEIIFYETDPDSSIYFIIRGRIEIFLERSKKELRILNAGCYFGEIKFLTGKDRRASAKSLNFSSLFYLEREDLLEVLESNPDEIESFCYMKDKVNLYKDYSLLNVYCYGCESLGHVLLECPRSNIHTTTFEIFKQIDFEDKRFRKSFIRFGRKKYNAISNLKLTQNAALKFMLERKNLIEIYSTLQQNNYPLDIVSSSDSIERDFDANLSDSSEEKKSYAETFVYSNEFSDSLEYLGPTWEGDARYSGEIIEKKRKYHQVVNFDRVKNFIYYFPHNNISNVIIKLEEMVQEKRKKESILIQKKKEEISE